MKVTLGAIKKNILGTSSRGDEAKNQNNLEHKEGKKHSIRTARRNKNSKNENGLKSLLVISNLSTSES